MCDCGGTCDDCCRDLGVLKGADGDDGNDGTGYAVGVGVPSPSRALTEVGYVDLNSPQNFYSRNADGTWTLVGPLKGLDGNGSFLTASITVTNTEVGTLFSLPKELIAAPPSGYFINILDAVSSTSISGNDWAGAGQLTIKYSAGSVIGSFGSNAATGQNFATKATLLSGYHMHVSSNVVLTNLGANPSGGTLSMKIRLVYQILPI